MQITQQLCDTALINAYLQGDEKSLEMLIHKHKDKIYTTIYMLVKDKYLAEDIFQDTLLKTIRTMQAGKYSEQGKFLPWVIRVAHNLCMDHFRKAKKNTPHHYSRWYRFTVITKYSRTTTQCQVGNFASQYQCS